MNLIRYEDNTEKGRKFTSVQCKYQSYCKSSFVSMYLLRCLTVLLVAALVSDVSALSLNNCTSRYQAALEEALTIKEQCEGAAFYDCCQVRSTSKLH